MCAGVGVGEGGGVYRTDVDGLLCHGAECPGVDTGKAGLDVVPGAVCCLLMVLRIGWCSRFDVVTSVARGGLDGDRATFCLLSICGRLIALKSLDIVDTSNLNLIRTFIDGVCSFFICSSFSLFRPSRFFLFLSILDSVSSSFFSICFLSLSGVWTST